MSTVAQVAKRTRTSSTTVRNWSAEFADHLSAGANPPKGQPRVYDEDDIAVLTTVATLRDQMLDYDEIRAALGKGERYEPAAGHDVDVDDDVDDEPSALAIAVRQSAMLQRQNEDLINRLVEAEKRAAAAERELDMVRGKPAGAKPDEPTRSEAMTFREWWRQWRR